MNLFISPHNDDEILFGCFTLLREKPLVLVVTDSYIQPGRGDRGCDAETRWQETRRALAACNCQGFRLGLRDDSLTEEDLREAFGRFSGFGRVYAPATQGGNWQHDLIGKAAQEVFNSTVRLYTTYTKTELWTRGSTEIVPTEEEFQTKIKALGCYQSQLNLPSTRPHFAAVIEGRSEWLI